MGGRWGGDIKGRRRDDRSRRDWQPPRVRPTPVPDAQTRAGALIAGIGFYILTLAGLLLTI